MINNIIAKIQRLIAYFYSQDSRKTAFAIAASLCIGTTPLIGLTFIIAFCFGFIFRLNQFIVQTVQVLVSPIQVVLFYPYLKLGQVVFNINDCEVKNMANLSDFTIYENFAARSFYTIIGATAIWLVLSIIIGPLIYYIVLKYLYRNDKTLIESPT